MQAGKVRAVAVTSLDRMPQLPDVEPLQNGAPGLKGYELLNWFGLFTTGGTPAAVVNRLNEIALKRLAEPKIAETLSTQGIVPRKMTPEQFKAFVAVGEQEVRRHHREGQDQARKLARRTAGEAPGQSVIIAGPGALSPAQPTEDRHGRHHAEGNKSRPTSIRIW